MMKGCEEVSWLVERNLSIVARGSEIGRHRYYVLCMIQNTIESHRLSVLPDCSSREACQ